MEGLRTFDPAVPVLVRTPYIWHFLSCSASVRRRFTHEPVLQLRPGLVMQPNYYDLFGDRFGLDEHPELILVPFSMNDPALPSCTPCFDSCRASNGFLD